MENGREKRDGDDTMTMVNKRKTLAWWKHVETFFYASYYYFLRDDDAIILQE